MGINNVLTNGIFLSGFANSESFKFLQSSKLIDPISPFPEDGAALTLVILSFNRVSFTIRLIDSVERHIPNYKGRILIVDNGSAEEQIVLLKKRLSQISAFKVDLICLGENMGVAGGRNKAIDFVETDWFMSLDNDIYLIGNPLPSIKDSIDRLGVLFLNVPLLQTDGKTIDAFGGNLWLEPCEDTYFMSGTSTFKQLTVNEMPKMTPFISTFLFGGASVINKKAFIENDCYDGNMFIGFEDTEFSLRLLKKGIKIGNSCSFDFIHAHEAPKTTADVDAEKVRFSANLIRESGEYFRKKHGVIVWKPSVDQWIDERFKELKIEGKSTESEHTFISEKEHSYDNQNEVQVLDIIDTNSGASQHPKVASEQPLSIDRVALDNAERKIAELQRRLNHAEYQIGAMRSSKFWKARNIWFNQRKKLGILDDGVPFSLKNAFKRHKSVINKDKVGAYEYDKFIKKVPVHKGETNVMVFIPFMVVGGAETAILQVLKGFKEAKFNTTLLVSAHPSGNMGDTSQDFYEICPDTYILEDYNYLWNDSDNWKHWKGLTYALIKDRKIDVVLISNSSFAYLLLEDLKRDFPLIKVINPVYSTVGHMVDNITYSEKIDMTIVENPLVEAYLVKDALRNPAKVKRIENGVDIEKYVPVRGKRSLKINNYTLPSTKKILTFLGRFSEEKGPDIFLDIAEASRGRNDIHFVLAGDGPMRAEIVENIQSRGLSSMVTFTGFADSINVLSNTDILLLPSRMDGRPNVVLEALAMGIPVIASNVGGLPWIIDKKFGNGIICQPDDISTFVSAIASILDTPDLLTRMKNNARIYAESELDVKYTQSAYLKVCKDLKRQSKYSIEAATVFSE